MEQGLPYIEPAYGNHAAPLDRERAREDAIQYLVNGRRILPEWGKHRRSTPVIPARKAA